MDKIRKKDFEAWYSKFGTSAKNGRYFQALRDPHYVLKDRAINPVTGYTQTIDYGLFTFSSIYDLSNVAQLRTLFDATPKTTVADDGSMHSAIGNYAMWLRLVSPDENWTNEPLWEGDDVPPGSGAKSRVKTLTANGFDYLKALKNRKATYMLDKYLAAIRTKPFILLAGISGTGKSRLVRQLARGCCPSELPGGQKHPLVDEQKPGNFEMIQVRPNWHDSTELMGYVTRMSGTPEYVLTPFVRFLAKAWKNLDVPFFLCLDEMNLAPVEQYFAEYLSVIETRRREVDEDGNVIITTDPLVRFDDKKVFKKVLDELFEAGTDSELIKKFMDEDNKNQNMGIPIPQNLVVMGTVNMDETTFSFSRKVLDRAMSFELSDVEPMYKIQEADKIDWGALLGRASQKYITAEDLYFHEKDPAVAADNKAIGDKVLKAIENVNGLLDKTPFKVAYRTRNEIMVYCVERTNYGMEMLPKALDEAISMKILSRIEGDSMKMGCKKDFVAPAAYTKPSNATLLWQLKVCILEELKKLDPDANEDKYPVCSKKLDEMESRLNNGGGFTGFWQ